MSKSKSLNMRGSGTLILIRHGQSVFNQQNRFTGWQNPDLSAQGIAEAKKTATKLEFIHLDIAFTSILLRAKHTLDLILEVLKGAAIPVISDKSLNERCYGELEGLNKAQTAEKYGVAKVELWRRSYNIKPPGGESLEDTAARVIPYFQKVISPNIASGKTVLVVAHGNSLRALVMHLENLSPEHIAKVEIPTCAPRIYRFNGDLTITNISDL